MLDLEFSQRVEYLQKIAADSCDLARLLLVQLTHVKNPALQERYIGYVVHECTSTLQERRNIRSFLHYILGTFSSHSGETAPIFPCVKGCLEFHALLAREVKQLRTHEQERRFFLEQATRLYARPELPKYEFELFRWCESILVRKTKRRGHDRDSDERAFQKEACGRLVSALLQNLPTSTSPHARARALGSSRRQLILLRHLRKFLCFWDTKGEICRQNFDKLCACLSSSLASREPDLKQAALGVCRGRAFSAALAVHKHRVTAFQTLIPHLRKHKLRRWPTLPQQPSSSSSFTERNSRLNKLNAKLKKFNSRLSNLERAWRQLDDNAYSRAKAQGATTARKSGKTAKSKSSMQKPQPRPQAPRPQPSSQPSPEPLLPVLASIPATGNTPRPRHKPGRKRFPPAFDALTLKRLRPRRRKRRKARRGSKKNARKGKQPSNQEQNQKPSQQSAKIKQ